MTHRALLIIDMQTGLFYGPDKPHNGAQVLANINILIDKAHQAGLPVYAAQHTGPIGSPVAPGSPLTQILPEINIDATTDILFDKTRPNCFTGTALAEWLQKGKIDEVIIAGMKTEFCIDTTCRAAADLGFNPVLISDAHTTVDNPLLPAQTIIAHHNKTLSGPFVRLMTTTECVF